MYKYCILPLILTHSNKYNEITFQNNMVAMQQSCEFYRKMDKNCIIGHSKRRQEKAENDNEYHIHRKIGLKQDIENLEEKLEYLELNMRSIVREN